MKYCWSGKSKKSNSKYMNSFYKVFSTIQMLRGREESGEGGREEGKWGRREGWKEGEKGKRKRNRLSCVGHQSGWVKDKKSIKIRSLLLIEGDLNKGKN